MLVEVRTFRLRPDADEAQFVAADARVQQEFGYQQPGLVRRTTARAGDGSWLDLTLWASPEEAERAELAAGGHDVVRAWTAYLDPTSVRVQRFLTLD